MVMGPMLTSDPDANRILKRRLQLSRIRALALRHLSWYATFYQSINIVYPRSKNMRKLKALGLAIAAMAALVAVTAPAAQAETGALTAAGFPSIVTGQQAPGVTFDIGAGPIRTVSCATSDLETTFAVAAFDPVTFRPNYQGCTSEPGGIDRKSVV